MNKILKSLVMAILGLTLVGTGVFAAATSGDDFSITNNVIFTSEEIYMNIEASSTQGADKEYSHIADITNKVPDAPAAWAVGDIRLTNSVNEVVYTFKFTNQGSRPVNIAFTLPTLDANQLKVEGGFKTAANAYSGNTAKIQKGEIAEFQYTIMITKFNSDFSNVAANFGVAMTIATA